MASTVSKSSSTASWDDSKKGEPELGGGSDHPVVGMFFPLEKATKYIDRVNSGRPH